MEWLENSCKVVVLRFLGACSFSTSRDRQSQDSCASKQLPNGKSIVHQISDTEACLVDL